MGRSKGIVEVRLEPPDVDDVANRIQSLMPDVMKGKSMTKDTIVEYTWALQPLAKLVPSQPVHQDTLFQVLQKVMPESAEGPVWLAVYDLKTLMQ
eukprot:s1892_g9.t1